MMITDSQNIKEKIKVESLLYAICEDKPQIKVLIVKGRKYGL